MTTQIVADMRARAAEYRDQATEHTSEAATLGKQLTATAEHLDDLAREEADLMRQAEEIQRKLDALRPEMISVRKAFDAIDAEQGHHAVQADAKTRAADYIEQRTLPDLAELLKPAPPHVQHAETGLMRDEPEPVDLVIADGRVAGPCAGCGGALVWIGNYDKQVHATNGEPWCQDTEPGPDDPPPQPVTEPGEVVAAITGGTPMPDPDALVGGDPLTTLGDRPSPDGQPRHAKPKKRGTGAFRAIVRREPGPDTPAHDDEQDGQADG